jgi:hypothetical protein
VPDTAARGAAAVANHNAEAEQLTSEEAAEVAAEMEQPAQDNDSDDEAADSSSD